ncbi:MAG: hybrid sensor histidine kinase/response regulator [Desulfobacteraceae bacterium IS3]|nr:MAG: hybrid sensor histidine kinase/response regulator [Desulfobacteraceae bacterium IS3]
MKHQTDDVNTILLADDEEDIREVLDISLSDMGYHVLTAPNGAEALRIFRQEKPPIVLSDIKMPGMDGIQLLQKIKQESPDTEVIMITGHGDMDLAVKSLKFEATDFITKPFNEDALEIALKRAKDRISMRRKLREYTENLEQLVEEKTRQLIEAERLAVVGETAAGLSHAIKNIAGGLRGGMFVLEKGIESDNKTYLRQGWEMIKGNVDKIKNLSLDLLNYGKSSEINCQLCDPNDPVREVVSLMTSQAEENGIELKAELSSELKPFFFDPEGLHRCLMNFVTNAIDACKTEILDDSDLEKDKVSLSLEGEGGMEVKKKVTVKTLKAEGWGAEYQIADNGCGMDEETRQRIFQSFFSTKGTRGTGIGLMITKKIIDRHKGEIEVKSEKGKGSTFIIRLRELRIEN